MYRSAPVGSGFPSPSSPALFKRSVKRRISASCADKSSEKTSLVRFNSRCNAWSCSSVDAFFDAVEASGVRCVDVRSAGKQKESKLCEKAKVKWGVRKHFVLL